MTYLWLAIAGAALGWMMGLSSSPVLSNVLTPILGVCVAIIGALAGLKSENDYVPKVVSVAPLSIFIAFAAVSMTAGVYARSNFVLVGDRGVSLVNSVPKGAGSVFGTEFDATLCGTLTTVRMQFAVSTLEELDIDNSIKSLLIILVDDEEKFRKAVNSLCS